MPLWRRVGIVAGITAGVILAAFLIRYLYLLALAAMKPTPPASPMAPITFWDQATQTAYLISAKQPVAGLLSYQPEAAALNFEGVNVPPGFELSSGAWDPTDRMGYVAARPAKEKGVYRVLAFQPSDRSFSPVGDAFNTSADHTSASWDSQRGCFYIFGWRMADGQLVSIHSYDPQTRVVSTQLASS